MMEYGKIDTARNGIPNNEKKRRIHAKHKMQLCQKTDPRQHFMRLHGQRTLADIPRTLSMWFIEFIHPIAHSTSFIALDLLTGFCGINAAFGSLFSSTLLNEILVVFLVFFIYVPWAFRTNAKTCVKNVFRNPRNECALWVELLPFTKAKRCYYCCF